MPEVELRQVLVELRDLLDDADEQFWAGWARDRLVALITCTSSTGWQVHIKTYSWGDTYHELVTPEGARYGWRYANGLAYKTRTTKTAKQMATSVTVIADDLASASRYCGTI